MAGAQSGTTLQITNAQNCLTGLPLVDCGDPTLYTWDVGGARYIKALKTSLPQIPLIAAGGVTQQTAASFILAGATAIGVGAELIPADAIANRETERIQELAHRFLGFVKDARRRLAPQETGVTPKTDFWKLHKHSKSDKH